MAAGSTTARLRVVSKCALREGRQRERSAQVIPGCSRFSSLLLVDHRPSSLCHLATFAAHVCPCAGLCVKSLRHSISGFSCERLCSIVRGLKGKNKGKIKGREMPPPALLTA